MKLQALENKGVKTAVVALALGIGVVGGSLLKVTQTNAQTTDATVAVAGTTTQPSQQFDPTKGGHVGTNGKTEELLTGDVAEKVKAAALAAIPGGTIQRVETDAEGDVYEAHMTKADGTEVTVKFDGNYAVTKTEEGRMPPSKTQ